MMPQKKGLTSSLLKWIAIVSMFLDHLALKVLYPLYLRASTVGGVDMLGDLAPEAAKRWYLLYLVLRSAGRIAFPIFAYLLAEGFVHTHSWRDYAKRLFYFAVLSEAAFDYPWSAEALSHQNVLWTLLIGLVLLHALERDEKREVQRNLTILQHVLMGMLAATLGATDYAFTGVLLIAVFYLNRGDFQKQMRYGGLVLLAHTGVTLISDARMWIQIFSLLAFLPLYFYNGRRGKGGRYFFYIFYPAHLLILGIIGQMLV